MLLLPNGDTLVLTPQEYEMLRPPMTFTATGNLPVEWPDKDARETIHKPSDSSKAGAN